MKRIVFVFLAASLSCMAQTAASNNTTTAPSISVLTATPGPPQVVPSDVALPGSGPPLGAPLSNLNDARTGGMVQVYNPATVLEHPVPATNEINGTNPGSGNNNGIPVNLGLQSFEGAASTQQQSGASLADIARQYRAQQHQVARSFTNDSVLQLGTTQLPQSREMSQSQSPQTNVQRQMAMAAAIPPMYAKSASPVPQNDAGASGAQQYAIDQQKRKSTPVQSAAANIGDNATTVAQNSEPNDQSGSNSSRLPASSSELPLLGLLGVAVAGGGALYMFRR